jgi:hypothetical protein
MDKKEDCCGEGRRNHCGDKNGLVAKTVMLLMLLAMAFLVWHGYRGAKRLVNGYLRDKEYARLNLAVDGCNRAAMRETVGASGVKVQEPIREVFTQCMEDKGYLEYRPVKAPVLDEEVME